mmetsp:Transcript_74782/g.217068  ORF Transcript_74782/g.217068 Transcript_74782/m.217068 type:complete len:810 (-) Transcript_74782:76-2505(-)|eukprot:CAMPEP_0176012100 /NCGR_PEP_ID=MMETSP0120_2-20121206/5623_1 /TAXON_ID=160619 /ORGANISM="Kryptoperidinium foliaceum, Strain CCMP 1326" /LENGTH=809 /DNA_ID=CAMNT_0017344979 /DNA_START=225 /DNA_END=2654 /DNA_ORIENTATION=+
MSSDIKGNNGGWGSNHGSSSGGRIGDNGGSSPRSAGAYDPRADGNGVRGDAGSAPPGFKGGNSDAPWHHGSDPSSDEPKRTSSFNNLAAALGSGLAESMEDATNGEHTKSMLTDSFLSNAVKEDISYARHSRHAASRMLGAGQTKDGFGSHKGLEVGSLFASFDSGERGLGKRGAGADPFTNNNFSKDREGSKNDDLSKAFSAGSLGKAQPGGFDNPYQTPSSFANARLSATKDLGMTAVEPDNYGRGSNHSNGGQDATYGLQRDMQRLWADRGSVPTSSMSAGSTDSIRSRSELQLDAEDDLRPFCWDTRHHDASRALVIMRASSLSASDVRSICEIYGAIESFRSDFVERGVFFVSYYDMRCAQYAAMELQPRLQKLGPSADRVLVQFCVPLNSSSHHDESLVVLMDVPPELNVEHLAAMLSSYGAVRSLKSMGGNFGGNSFVVEYHDIQDAKQAVLELESTQQFGPNVSVEVGARNPADRKRGRELLALIGRWRHGAGSGSRPTSSQGAQGRYGSHTPPRAADVQRFDMHGGHPVREPTPQLVLGPDGRYSYVVVNDHSRYPGGPPQYADRGVPSHGNPYVSHVNPPNQHHYWQPQTHHFSSTGSVVSHSSYGSSGHYPSGSQSLPYGSSSVGSHSHRMSAGPSSASSGGGVDNSHLVLDLDAVENGLDSRTSLMVRNIPNKYTQQMLLNEFTENGHGPGVIDFFYLPIDFKNRCNRGYAFINFVDYRDILAFHRRYFGKHWRTFNSDKICDITYARIQGKAAMLKRFENSALMEKDDEYKPLVFVSNGPDKGTRLPFPTPPNKLS